MLGAPPGGVFGGVNVLCSSRSREAATYAAQWSIERSTQWVARSSAAATSAPVTGGAGSPAASGRSMLNDGIGSRGPVVQVHPDQEQPGPGRGPEVVAVVVVGPDDELETAVGGRVQVGAARARRTPRSRRGACRPRPARRGPRARPPRCPAARRSRWGRWRSAGTRCPGWARPTATTGARSGAGGGGADRCARARPAARAPPAGRGGGCPRPGPGRRSGSRPR